MRLDQLIPKYYFDDSGNHLIEDENLFRKFYASVNFTHIGPCVTADVTFVVFDHLTGLPMFSPPQCMFAITSQNNS
jgi:hypothetical protein